MDKNLDLHIKKLQRRAIIDGIAIILLVISVIFLFCLIFNFWIITIGIISIIYLIYSNHITKKELRITKFEPIVFKAKKHFSFKKIINIFDNLTKEENKICLTDDLLFYRLNEIFKLRVVLYKTETFCLNDFDKAKKRINKFANKKLKISHWVNKTSASKMMRFNIIYVDSLNDTLYQFISQNANHNLRRVEGIINIAIIGNQIIIPPIYGSCDFMEVSRYKNTIKFIKQNLLDNNNL